MQFGQYSRIAILLKKSIFGQKFENEFEIWKKKRSGSLQSSLNESIDV